jgi:hypothetical protein
MVNHRRIILSAVILAAVTPGLYTVSHAAEEITDTSRRQGMAKAPDLVKAAGIACTVTDARKVPVRLTSGDLSKSSCNSGSNAGSGGGGNVAGAGTGSTNGGDWSGFVQVAGSGPTPDQYEVACGEGLGYLINSLAGKTPSARLCLDAMNGGQGPARAGAAPAIEPCLLPGNSSDSARSTVSAYIAKTEASAACELDRLRVIGHSAKATYIEVSCRSGGGYILAGAYPLRPDQPVQSINCSAVPPGGAIKCQLSDSAAAQAASVPK